MDERYREVAEFVAGRFVSHLSPRLKSAFVQGSVARGDAVWDVSDLDLVLVFDAPTEADTAIKREIELAARELPGGDALVIHRIGEDRLVQMTPGLRAYWLHSCRYEADVLHGSHPRSFLPLPPEGSELARLIAPIIREEGEKVADKPVLDRQCSRHLAKLILHALALPTLAEEIREYIPPLTVRNLDLPREVMTHIPWVLSVYRTAPTLENPEALRHAWRVAWAYVETILPSTGKG